MSALGSDRPPQLSPLGAEASPSDDPEREEIKAGWGRAKSGLAPTPASRNAEHLLDILNVLLSDVRYGLGAYLGVYLLSEHRWDEASIGLALSAGGVPRLFSPHTSGAG